MSNIKSGGPIYLQEKGGIVLSLLISTLICMVIFYYSFMFLAPYNYFNRERFKADTQSYLVQTRHILSRAAPCESIFKGKSIKAIQKAINENKLSLFEKFTFGRPGVANLVYTQSVEISLAKAPILAGGKGYHGQIQFLMDSKHNSAVRDPTMPFYFVLDSAGLVQKCHATLIDKNNMTLEDRACSIYSAGSVYDPDADKCVE